MTGSDPLRLYRTVRLIRRFEERAIELVRAGEIVGGIHPYLGQEGIAAGVCAALDREDLVTGTHRGHGHVLAKGADPARMLAELCGRVTGLNRGRGGSMHAADFGVGVLGANAIVGAAGAILTGAVWERRRRGADIVGATFFGDGAVNEGMLLEAFNLAALWRIPVLFVCENNGYATTMPVDGAVAGTIAGRAAAFGMPAATVDGQDPEAVREVTAAAVARMRAGGGPELVEARTYRFDAHHTFEHQVRLDYRPPEEVAEGRSRDPVDIAGARLDPAVRAEVDAAVEAELDAAVDFALAGPHPDPATALDHLYASGLTARTGGG
ncbi:MULTISPECIES: thiamine pyrophosphate-dependent dehydrogenase E1 component subunit alpha [Micromonospora]|uniref:Thiamine pyrophosphate-dependent dehydrogenase E1 component subunit alpha n=1 Tax=Micromonospora aurantiaca (nom. illeg.) TaxID=47850 RepID=A0ABQ6U8G0_9ACTN|nr:MULTISPECIES: thiamine pyrophosphate-dependent dehydrogenase E1 component subunit alpha [Micromonospora]KAB1102731.1 thiamine pyrophosphate-dependent dehydrogenase E1 component subunit alpha [Micromonospora aurantiaca]MBC9005509.1 thiamine pyrophosphate-dependent dehydrogenase E1 component subunit alpha [Micromonospora aurantiaca]UFN91804.1 thiamine pyrophosphate-dependent dehydrogenase E1 component subunit alpha [Micromonospora aurantiaca]SCL24367.1 pyruvate dehydrogenase E1 component alpha